jgi:hypothetical protein
MPVNYTNEAVFDGFLELSGGVNSGWVPTLIPNNTLSFAWNCTVRGGFLTHRPAITVLPLSFENDTIRKRVVEGNFQGSIIYTPDNATPYAVASISGRLFKFPLTEDVSRVTEITISSATLTAALFNHPLETYDVQISVNSTANIFPNAPIQIGLYNYTVVSVDSATLLTIKNVDGPPGNQVNLGTQLISWDVNPALRQQAWFCQAEKWLIIQDGQSLPIFWDGAKAKRSIPSLGQMTGGKMMEYHRGRVAKVNPDGRTYSIGDIVYGPSGTAGEQFRDAVLYATENTYLAGGGFFSVPGNYGDITFMRGMAQLETAFGQGPLMIGTEFAIFSVDLPTDRTTWTSITDPIQAVAHIASGGTSQNSAVNVNSDLYYRSQLGVRSLIQAQRDFQANSGNTPVSREMNRLFLYDDETLLNFSSGVFFDNRLLMTSSPSYSARGTFHRAIAALDLDVLSSMRDKSPAVWEGAWLATNTLQLMASNIDREERCFEFQVSGEGDIELWELTKQGQQDRYGDVPIKWAFETADFFRKGESFHELDMKRLINGELYVEDLKGFVTFKVWWKPDQYPCWTYWFTWSECANEEACAYTTAGCPDPKTYRPQFRHRMQFGQPPDTADTIGRKKLREGRTFQVRVEIIGHCKVRGMRLMAIPIKEPGMPQPDCVEFEDVSDLSTS